MNAAPPPYIFLPTARLRHEWMSPIIPPIARQAVIYAARIRLDRYGRSTTITSIFRTVRENDALHSKSMTHPDFRAIDYDVIDECADDWEEDVRQMALAKFPTGLEDMPRIAPLRHGSGPHGHVQATIQEQLDWLKKLEGRGKE